MSAPAQILGDGTTAAVQAAPRAGRRLRQRVLRRERLDLVALGDDGASLPDRDLNGVRIRRAHPAEAPALAPLVRDGEPPERRFARGHGVYVAEEDGRLLAACWVADRPFRIPHYRLRVAPRRGEQYGYSLFVAPEARRRGIGSALLRSRIEEGRRSGLSLFTAHVDPRNPLVLHRQPSALLRETLVLVVLFDRFGLVVRRRRLT